MPEKFSENFLTIIEMLKPGIAPPASKPQIVMSKKSERKSSRKPPTKRSLALTYSPILKLIYEITDTQSLIDAAPKLGISEKALSKLVSYPERFNVKYSKKILEILKRNHSSTEQKKHKIQILEESICLPNSTYHNNTNSGRQTREDCCYHAGLILGRLRKECGISDQDLPALLNGISPVVKKNIAFIEAGRTLVEGKKIDPSIYRSAIDALAGPNGVYRKLDPVRVSTCYSRTLQTYLSKLKR